MKKMIVCIKQIMDPEAPADAFHIDSAAKTLVPDPKTAQVISPFDEHALEAALRIKEAQGGEITVLSLGTDLRREVLKKSLAMGADKLVLLEDESFAGGDGSSTATALAAAIKKIGTFDLILCGRQAADWDSGQVGSGIAELLALPSVTLARKIEFEDGKGLIERVTADGFEVIETALPCLVTVTNELGEVRYPKLMGMMKAKKIAPTVWTLADIGLDASQVGAAGRRSRLVGLFERVQEGMCEFVEAETEEEAGVRLALKLREAKIL